MGCAPGWFVQGWHSSDYSGVRFAGRISGATTHELASLSGYGGHQWQPGDRYQVLINMALGSVQWDVHTATGGSDTTLEDSAVDFLEVGIQVGMYVYNMTTGGGGRVTELRTTTNPNDTLVFSNGLHGEPDLVGPTRGNTTSGDQYLVYNTLASQDDVISMEFYAAPEGRLTSAVFNLGFVPTPGEDASFTLSDTPARPPRSTDRDCVCGALHPDAEKKCV